MIRCVAAKVLRLESCLAVRVFLFGKRSIEQLQPRAQVSRRTSQVIDHVSLRQMPSFQRGDRRPKFVQFIRGMARRNGYVYLATAPRDNKKQVLPEHLDRSVIERED